jgi:hypothetical protein
LLQVAFIRSIVEKLEATHTEYAITGSVASNYWGIPRLTHDVDVVVVLSVGDIPAVLKTFGTDYYVSEDAVRQALANHGMFNVIDTGHALKADLWHVSADPFNQTFLGRRQRVVLFPEVEAWLGSAEDVLLHKLVWNKITPSERQLQDAAGIAAVQAGKLDLAYMRAWAARQGTSDELEAVLAGKGLKAT